MSVLFITILFTMAKRKKKKTQKPGNNPNVYLTGEWFSKL